MLIKNITIENFQSYYKSQTLEFSNGLNLIIGKGGKGKSKLFNAFFWVLFGDIYITDLGWCTTNDLPNSAKNLMKRHDFINNKALSEANVGDVVVASVSLEILDDKDKTYIIQRSVAAKRLNQDSWNDVTAWTVSDGEVKVSFETPTGTKVKLGFEAEDVINGLFPTGIRNYIWFQGESLDSLIDFRNKQTLKNAVKHISYYPYYEKLSAIISKSKEKIEKLENTARKEANKKNDAVKNLLNSIEKNGYHIEQEKANIQKYEENINIMQIKLDEGETKISGLATFTKLVEEYKSCENEIDRLLAQMTKQDDFQRDKLPKLWVLRGIKPMIEKAREIISNHKEEEASVPEKKYLDNPSRAKLEEILADGKCYVCGSSTHEGTEAHDYIINRIKAQEEYLREMEEYTSNMQEHKLFNMFIGKLEDYPNPLCISLDTIDKQYQKSEDEAEKFHSQYKKKLEEKKELDEEIERIKAKHNVDPVKESDTAGIISSTIKATRSRLESERRKLDAAKASLLKYQNEVKNAEKELEKIGKKDATVVKVPQTEWKNISIFLEEICKRVQESARKDLLKQIEKKANAFYKKFTEHDNGYTGHVVIGDDYSIEFDSRLNTSHEDRKKMSVINALLALNQEAVQTYYPFISDAPTSSFDLETTHKYLLGIKDIFNQSIIMTKDVDVESDNYENLISQDKVSRIFILESEIYCDEKKTPELHEVSTRVQRRK